MHFHTNKLFSMRLSDLQYIQEFQNSPGISSQNQLS